MCKTNKTGGVDFITAHNNAAAEYPRRGTYNS